MNFFLFLVLYSLFFPLNFNLLALCNFWSRLLCFYLYFSFTFEVWLVNSLLDCNFALNLALHCVLP